MNALAFAWASASGRRAGTPRSLHGGLPCPASTSSHLAQEDAKAGRDKRTNGGLGRAHLLDTSQLLSSTHRPTPVHSDALARCHSPPPFLETCYTTLNTNKGGRVYNTRLGALIQFTDTILLTPLRPLGSCGVPLPAPRATLCGCPSFPAGSVLFLRSDASLKHIQRRFVLLN